MSSDTITPDQIVAEMQSVFAEQMRITRELVDFACTEPETIATVSGFITFTGENRLAAVLGVSVPAGASKIEAMTALRDWAQKGIDEAIN